VSLLDLVVLGIVSVYALLGYWRGFLAVGAELFALLFGFLAAALLYRRFGDDPTGWGPAVAFIAIWLCVTAVVEIVLKRILKHVPEETRKSPTNRVLGVFPSALKGVVAGALVVTLYVVASHGKADSMLQRSAVARPLVDGVMRFQGMASNAFGGAVEEFQHRLGRDSIVEDDRGVPLGFQTNDGRIEETAETRMLLLLNRERRAHGLVPLLMNERLRVVARAHTLDMVQRGYFAHVSPDGLDPFDRMRRAGIRYTTAGENLAKAPTVEVAHEGLMKSPGHRKNILTEEYRQVGIGAVSAGVHGLVFSQEFTD
jgi:uncharacterized protein YkwD/uncharacterized membrane protein required for colicin V production